MGDLYWHMYKDESHVGLGVPNAAKLAHFLVSTHRHEFPPKYHNIINIIYSPPMGLPKSWE